MNEHIWLLVRGVVPSPWAYRIRADRQILGRSVECDFQIVHDTVSRHHAEIWEKDGTLRIRDLKSSNGTFVNGKRVADAKIGVGDKLKIGRVDMDVLSRAKLLAAAGDNELKSTALVAGQNIAEAEHGARGFSLSQLEVLRLLLQGLPEKKVAAALCLSPHTVHSHVKHIYRLLGVRSRPQLMALYVSSATTELPR